MKKNYIYAVLFTNNRKLVIRKVELKEDNTFSYDNKSYNISKDDFVIYKKKYVAFMYNENNTNPIDPVTGTVTKNIPRDYNTALTSKLLRDLISQLGGNTVNAGVILSIISMLLIVGVGVLMYITNNNLQVLIEDLQSKLNILLGGVQ